MNIVKRAVLTLLVFPALSLGLVVPNVMAASCDADGNAKVSTQEAINCGAKGASGSNQTSAQAEGSINQTITSIVNVLSVVVAIVAVIMIILGGFRYVTSAGAADKIKSAKDTILYALIGLVIVAMAQAVVRYVINQATTPPPSTTSSQNSS